MDFLTYEEAKAKVLAHIVARWGTTPGTPHVGDDGWEDDAGFLVPYGAREFLVDGDDDFSLFNDVSLIVNRYTTLVEVHNTSQILERINSMTAVAAKV